MKNVKSITLQYVGDLEISGLDKDEIDYHLENNTILTYEDYDIVGNTITIYPWELEIEFITNAFKLAEYLESEVVTITMNQQYKNGAR